MTAGEKPLQRRPGRVPRPPGRCGRPRTSGLVSRIPATCLVLLLVGLAAATPAWAGPCRLAADHFLKAGGKSSIAVDLATNSVAGRIRVGKGARAADGTSVRAHRVRLAPESSVFDVAADTVSGTDGATLRGQRSGAPSLPLEPDFFAPTLAEGCGSVGVEVPRGGTRDGLVSGDYGVVVVGTGATLHLGEGTFRFCRLEVGPRASVLLGPDNRGLHVAGGLVLKRGARVVPAAQGPLPTVEVAGAEVRLGRSALLVAALRAGSARLKTAPRARLVGDSCASVVRLGRNGAAECPAETCGDGAFDPGEECDPPRDHACRGACAYDCSCARDPWRFTDVTDAAGAGSVYRPDIEGTGGAVLELATVAGGVAAGDFDGDGWIDLFAVGGALGRSRLLRNRGDGTFEDTTVAAGLDLPAANDSGPAFADIDGDGDLDLFIGGVIDTEARIFRNDDGVFTDTTEESGLVSAFRSNLGASFGDGAGGLDDATSAVNSAENAMGQAVADYDNDGDLDWFITSIFDPDGTAEANWGTSGNRLYRNRGDGTFDDVTEAAGVRRGFWGWGACFADFDLDGRLDLFHVNGFTTDFIDTSDFDEDPSRLFLGSTDGTFAEVSMELGIDDRDQGRGVVCFDYDRDGDIDVFIANGLGQPSRLLRNDLPGGAHFLEVRLLGRSPNTAAAGARVYARTGEVTQMREIHIASNYLSQNPAVAHFGLGPAMAVDELRIVWPDGSETVESDVAADRFLLRSRD